jgi:small nuclear ribonucleoprotein D3
MTSTLGVPVKLLHEALGHVITVELKTGQLYRGKLAEGLVNLIDTSQSCSHNRYNS